MKKLLIVLLFVLPLHAQEIKKYQELNSVAKEIWKHDFADTTTAYRMREIKAYKDSLIFFTEKYGKCIYKYDVKTNNVAQISGKGNGPGEYHMPWSLYLEGSTLFFDDGDIQKIEGIDFNGKYKSRIPLKTTLEAINIFCLSDNKAYFLRSTAAKNWLANTDGKEYFKQDEFFNSKQYVRYGGGIFEYKEVVYAINSMESKILVLDTKKDEEQIIELNGMDLIFNLKPYLGSKVSFEEYKQITVERMKVNPIRLIKIEHNKQLFFGVVYYQKIEKMFYLGIFNQKGKSVLNIKTGVYSPFDYLNGVLKCTKNTQNSDETLGFANFKFNVNVLSKFK